MYRSHCCEFAKQMLWEHSTWWESHAHVYRTLVLCMTVLPGDTDEAIYYAPRGDKSKTGPVLFMSVIVHWAAPSQPMTKLSSCESECHGAVAGIKLGLGARKSAERKNTIHKCNWIIPYIFYVSIYVFYINVINFITKVNKVNNVNKDNKVNKVKKKKA